MQECNGVRACRFWDMTKWDSRQSQLPRIFCNFFVLCYLWLQFFFMFSVETVFSVLSDSCMLFWRCLCVFNTCTSPRGEFQVSLTYAWSYALDYVSDSSTELCGQLACSSQNWKHWEVWCREAGLICLLVCLLPTCLGLYCVHVQARLETSLLISCVPQWMLLYAYLPFFVIFLLSVLRKLTCIFWGFGLSSLCCILYVED